MTALRGVLWLSFVALLGACGGASPAKSPGQSSSDVDALAEDLEAAERSLSAELGPPASAPGAAAPTPGGATGGGSVTTEKGDEEPKTPSPEPTPAQSAPMRPSSPCETACKALASMKRSQVRICEIAGESHERCEWAKKKVTEASTRVEKAGCGCEG